MKKRSVKMYNLIFPVWLLLTPLFWPIVACLVGPLVILFILVPLAGNFVIDWLVCWLALRLQKVEAAWQRVRRVIVRVWLCGFAADIIGSLPLLFLMLFDCNSDWFYQNIEYQIFYGNPFTSFWAVLYLLGCIFLAGVAIYCLNARFCLKAADLEPAQKKWAALALAVFTAPWFFLLPTSWYY